MTLTICKDARSFPIHASSFEEMRRRCAEANRSCKWPRYGTVAEVFGHPDYPGECVYFDIYTEKRVDVRECGWQS